MASRRLPFEEREGCPHKLLPLLVECQAGGKAKLVGHGKCPMDVSWQGIPHRTLRIRSPEPAAYTPGTKSGPHVGFRLGYSQIANPIYLARKGQCFQDLPARPVAWQSLACRELLAGKRCPLENHNSIVIGFNVIGRKSRQVLHRIHTLP
jgi:hypothetical protein